MPEIKYALVVEDDLWWCQKLTSLLEQMGFQVETATDENAPEKSKDGAYAIALVDVSLRAEHDDQLGVEVARRLKRASPETRVILQSAWLSSSHAMSEAFARSVADDVIAKDQLDALIDSIVRLVPSARAPGSAGRQAELHWKRAAAKRRARRRAERQGRPLVLVVEDTTGWKIILDQLVERAGAFAEVVNTYQNAMSGMQQQRYAAVIVDLRLSLSESDNRDGKAFIEDVRAKFSATPVFAVSGVLDKDLSRYLYSLGVVHVEDKNQLYEHEFQFVETLQTTLAKYVPSAPEEWTTMIWDFLKAYKQTSVLDETTLARHPRFAGQRRPGDVAFKEIKRLIRAKIEDESLSADKRKWLKVVDAYYLSSEEEPPRWKDLVKKFGWAERTLKNYARQGVQEFAKMAYEAFSSHDHDAGR